MKDRLRTIAKWVFYPLFYLFCLGLFGYLTFPYNRLRDRLIAEFDHAQSKRSSSAPQRLEIDELSSYWFTGVEATGVRLILPADEPSSSGSMAKAALATMGAPQEAPKDSVLEIDEVQARMRVLPLLLGRRRVAFTARAFEGKVTGVVPVGAASGPVEVELSDLNIGLIQPLVQLIGLPVKGVAAGQLNLEASEGKFNKANGAFELTVSGASVGDGKTKWKGQVALPEARLGDITITAEATTGVLKITKLASTGPDVELIGEGKVQVREPWNDSTADLYVRFKFSDAYRDKNDDTRSLLGVPGASLPGLIEIVEPKVKRAKRADGFYGFHVHGPLKKLKFDPTTLDAPGGGSSKTPRSKSSETSPFAGPRKGASTQLPLGTSQVNKDDAPPPPSEPSPVADPSPAKAPEPEMTAPPRPQREEQQPPPTLPAPEEPMPAPRAVDPPAER